MKRLVPARAWSKNEGCVMPGFARRKRLTPGKLLLVTLIASLALVLGLSGVAAAPIAGGLWLVFAFGAEGGPAIGCAPADPDGKPGCPQPAGSAPAPAPPWQFTAPAGGSTLTVVDGFRGGDQFKVLDFDVSIGTTSAPASGWEVCGADPERCLSNPKASSGVFPLAAGPHSITIVPIASPFKVGVAFFRVESVVATTAPDTSITSTGCP
jgi:hypothetical protein